MLKARNKYGEYFLPREIEYTYTAQTILNGGVHEESTIAFLASLEGNIVHAGAGFGDFLPALKSFDRVFAFEPNELMYECARKTIEANGLDNIVLYPFALSNQNDMGLLSHIDEQGREMGPRSEISAKGTKIVRMVRLDSIVSEKISVIHLDLEGHEFAALEGARDIIERDRPVIVLEIDTRAVDYNNFMLGIGYSPTKQLIYNSNEQMVFVNTVYSPLK
jgi:FkbM family methyltransferase